MGAELGRISGPLLSADLLRNGVDLAFETDLLYLDVNNGRIGINTDTPSRLLTVSGTASTTNLISDTSLTIDDFIVSSNRIQHTTGEIYISPNQTLDPTILITTVETDDLRVTNQLIKNFTADDSIELSPSGVGLINFYTDKVNISGNLHATGNITWDGDIIFGNNDSDSVTFNSDITSNIIPNVTATYDLGTELKQWNNLFVNEVVADNIEVDSILVNGINLTLLTGNTIYVSLNGNNDNLGTHFSDPVRTLKYALSTATAGDEIVIFPGTYVEEFPLTIPQGVSIRGAGIRAVTIEPTALTNDKDCFLLNGDTTVQFLTIQNFFYNAEDNTGYAFRFADDFKTLARSPYIYNVSVITKGSVTSLSDPLGFTQGDAGAGAYLDGSVADSTGTIPPSALFFGVTFITPNQDGITLLNGVRAEWINGFTYYAKRAIYLQQGTAGRSSQGTIFGAEMRSISSANVYGTYGAVADGADTLAYLIGHNFGYIGSGSNNLNDRSTVVQANEIVKLNSGQIYFDSIDHKGDYRVGDIFYVNQETGVVSFDAQSINFGAQGNITLEGPSGSTILNKDFVQSGNIRFYGNTIASLVGPVNVLAISGTTTLNTDVFVTGNIQISNNFIIDGTLFLGNDPFDLISIAPDLTQNIVPKTTDTFTLGTNEVDPKRWNDLYTGRLDVDGIIEIDNNTIKVIDEDADLIIDAGGVGVVNILSTVIIDNNLTVHETSNLLASNIGITDALSQLVHIGDVIQTGDAVRTGNVDISGYIDVNGEDSQIQFVDISIVNNTISTTIGDNDLILVAPEGDLVSVLASDVDIANNLDVFGLANFDSITGVDEVSALDDLTAGSVYIKNNYIVTLDEDQDLQLNANGAGTVYVSSNDVVISNNLTIEDDFIVDGAVQLLDTEITGTVTLVGNLDQTGDTYITGNFNNTDISILSPSYFEVPNVRIEGTVIRTTSTDSDLNFNADGDGGVVFARQLKIAGNVISNIFDSTDISLVFNNLFETEDSRLLLTEDGDNYLIDAKADRDLSIIFDPIGTSNVIVDSNKAIAIAYGNNSDALLESVGEIRQNSITKRYEGWTPNGLVSFTDLYDTDGNTYITAELTPGADDNIIRFGVNNSVIATISSTSLNTNTMHVDNVSISGSTINNLISSTDLFFLSNGTGVVNINNNLFNTNTITNDTDGPLVISNTGTGYVKFAGSNAIVIPAGEDIDRRNTPELGELRYNTERGYTEIYDGNGWISTSGASSSATEEEIKDETDLWAFILG